MYADPRAYEIAYSFRDIPAECAFLCDCVSRRRGRRPAGSVELGAGPAVHSRWLAAHGTQAVAVDREPGAAAYLAAVAPEVMALTADMREFALPHPVDLAFCPLGSFAYLLEPADWQLALAACAAALHPRGALVLEFAPGDAARVAPQHWSAECDGLRVEATAGPTGWATETAYTWELTVVLEGPAGPVECRSAETQRLVTPAFAEEQLRASGAFGEVELFSDYDRRRRWHGEPSLVVTAARR